MKNWRGKKIGVAEDPNTLTDPYSLAPTRDHSSAFVTVTRTEG